MPPFSRPSFVFVGSLCLGVLSSAVVLVFAPAWMPYAAAHVPALRSWIEKGPFVAEWKQGVSRQAEDGLLDVVARTSRAVVSIRITKEVAVGHRMVADPFENLFGGSVVPLGRGSGVLKKERREIGGGSGFFVSADGMVVTNGHVVRDKAAEYTVVTQDQKTYPAKILAVDPVLDIAILKVDIKQVPFLSLGDSDRLRIGQTVVAIGNTLDEFQNTVTKGVVSGLNRRVVAGNSFSNTEVIESAIQTDAAINPGNSGGPLVDLNGEVIGVNTAVSQTAQSLGFALPANAVKRAVTSVQAHGRIVRAWLGVRFLSVDEELAKQNHLAYSYGALVLGGERDQDVAVVKGSPADKAGLVENDLILEVNGTKLEGAQTLSSFIERCLPGDVLHLKIVEKGKEKMVDVTLDERPSRE